MNKYLLLLALWIFTYFVILIIIPSDKGKDNPFGCQVLSVLFATMVTAFVGGLIL